MKVEIPLKYATSFYDEIRDAWVMEEASYDVEVVDGIGAQDSLTSTIDITKTMWWNGL